MSITVIIMPGYQNSGPAHWQSEWCRRYPTFQRLNHSSWDFPRREIWVDELSGAIAAAAAPVILVAHSLGCMAAAHWAPRNQGQVVGMLLVAPADVELATAPDAIKDFAPVPLRPLGVPATVVASRDDPYATMARSRVFAEHWGADLEDLGSAGHINVDAGFGPWPAGIELLRTLIRRCGYLFP